MRLTPFLGRCAVVISVVGCSKNDSSPPANASTDGGGGGNATDAATEANEPFGDSSSSTGGSSGSGGMTSASGGSPADAGPDVALATTPLVAKSISAAGFQSCAVLNDATVRCWGYNFHGELGNGAKKNSPLPVKVSGITNAASVACGGTHTCAVLGDGSMQCWGGNGNGQLGNGTTNGSLVPVAVSGMATATTAIGGGMNTCALLRTGSMQCWGYNFHGQLGIGSAEDSHVPADVVGVSDGVAIAAGTYHGCVVQKSGAARCWGNNVDAQLGSGSRNNTNVPLPVVNLSGAGTIAAGYGDTCSVMKDSTLECWGYNNYGQIGNGLMMDSPVPVAVAGIADAVGVAVGEFHACAVLKSGSVMCWGNNSLGQLGDGTTTNSALPVAVQGITSGVAVALGRYHSCALLRDGTIRCWGEGGHGELGYGGTTFRAIPVTVLSSDGGGTVSEAGIDTADGPVTSSDGGAGADAVADAPYCPNRETDPSNCGCCGNVCGVDQTCRAGRCEATSSFGFFLFGDAEAGSAANNATVQTAMSQMVQVDPHPIAGFANGDLLDLASEANWAAHDSLIAAAGFHSDLACASSFGAKPRYFATVGNNDTRGGDWYGLWNSHLSGQQGLGPNSEDGIYYSLTYANALFIMLDTEHPSAAQTTWLASLLASSDAENAKLKFMFMHEPVYPCVSARAPFGAGLPWVDLAERYKVNVVFGSHTHVYTRTCPRKAGTCSGDGTGVVFVETGPVGADVRAIDVATATVTGTDAAGNARTDTYSCQVGQGLVAAGGSHNDFCHVKVDGCQAKVECYGVGEGNLTPFDTWTVSNCP